MYLMKCGHVANAKDENGSSCCAICAPRSEAFQIAKHCEGNDGLEGRSARCIYNCGKKIESKWELPFFKYQPDQEFDSYYCGCFGWD